MKRLGCLHPLGTPRPLGGPKFHATWSLPSSCRKLPICCFTNGKHASCLLVPWRSRAQFHPPYIPHRRSSDRGYCAKPCGRRLLPCFWVSVSRQLAPPRGCVLAERARSPYHREYSLMPAKFQLLHVLRRYTRPPQDQFRPEALPTYHRASAECAFPAAHSHIPSAPLTCARAMCPQAGALVFVAAGGALARGAAARRARLRRDPF